jgi:type I restriction enzyme R subunit
MTNEAFSRVKIDAQLRDQGWAVENPNAIRYEYVLPDGTKADYVLNDRHGRAMAAPRCARRACGP